MIRIRSPGRRMMRERLRGDVVWKSLVARSDGFGWIARTYVKPRHGRARYYIEGPDVGTLVSAPNDGGVRR